MYLPLIRPATHSDICVIGDVTIHDNAVIAPGTILQAAPGCRILIKEGACIGMGSLLNAYNGDIEVASGAMLGAGVLVVGHSQIGQNACIGSSTTIINSSIDSGTAIAPGSLLGDQSRQVTAETSEPTKELKSENNGSVTNNNSSISNKNNIFSKVQPTEDKKPNFVEEMQDLWAEPEPEVEPIAEVSPPPKPSVDPIPEVVAEPKPSPEPQNAPVVGQIYINQLLYTLFPERQAFNRSQNGSSS
ncbi:carbon dioxide concentrating mechanism protein [Rippkaea orientalis PCC 8801]|uniref:Carbon dioxide concentrating mechanism protein n=1 Tax=Rippkaea orientalis (strain PCC 8801 / RF-1) TaxID=41431 RepID=B7JVW3_RIPO1|nr:transferase [Rippkaea orientalis]ACK65652.1 carbon dioxide concentrating mechanism protein [Rippkaea orientalis PCC 8801]